MTFKSSFEDSRDNGTPSQRARAYRSHARKCMELAQRSEAPRVRAQYRDIAKFYLRLAEAAERRATILLAAFQFTCALV